MDIETLLEAGVARKIIDDGQRRSLIALRDEQAATAAEVGDEERFQFVRSFDDIFLAIGVSLLVGGLAYVAIGGGAIMLGIAAAASWGICEIITARHRRRIPSMIAAVAFVVFTGLAVGSLFLSGFGFDRLALAFDKPAMLAATAAAVLFYWRFRLPFALLLVALCVVGLLYAVLFGTQALPEGGAFRLFILLSGLAVFAVAMRYDRLDPRRETRFGDCAFWLHIGAAPMIVHAALASVGGGGEIVASANLAIALAVLVGLALVALIVDRRALIVSGLIYAFSLLSRLLESVSPGISGVGSILLLGLGIVFLSLGWRACRNLLVGRTPLRRLVPYIPDLRR